MRRRELLAAAGVVALSSGPVRVNRGENGRDPSSPGEPTQPDPGTPADPGDDGTPPGDDEGLFDDTGAFDRTVDVVADLGCSPDGDEPCNGPLSGAVDGNVLFRFPGGRYRFDGSIPVRGPDRVGFVGHPDEEVRLLPPDGFNAQLFDVAEVGQVNFGNVTVDVTGDATTAGLRFITREGFRVENVRYRGRGVHPSEQVTHAFYLAVKDPGSRGVLRNVVATRGSAIGHYKQGNGRGGVWIGPAHEGTAYIENCEFAEFGNNGVYASRNPGTVHVRGGTFRNNNVAGVRLSGPDSSVVGTDIEVDVQEYEGPRTRLDEAFKTRGVVVEQGPFDNEPGVTVRDSTVAVRSSPNPGAAVDLWPTGKTVAVVGSTLRAAGDTPVVFRSPRTQQGNFAPSQRERAVSLVDVTVGGTDSQYPVVLLRDAPGSLLRDCRVERAGQGRDGVSLVQSPATLFDGGTIAAARYPIVVDAGDAPGDCLVGVDRLPTLRAGVDRGDRTWVALQTGGSCGTVGGTVDEARAADCGRCLPGDVFQEIGASMLGITGFRDERVALDVV